MAKSFLNAGDWTVIVAYLLGIIVLGSWFGKDQRNTRDYFLGSKDIPWWGIGLSIVAAETSALTIIGVPGLAYGGNIGMMQLIIGYVIARVILAIVLVPHYFKGEIYSPYQIFANTFGQPARQTAAGFFLLSETLAAGVRVFVACIPLQLILGVGEGWSIVLFVVLSLIYTYFGGVKAVIWTDAAQFGLFVLGGLFTIFYIPHLFAGGWSEVWNFASAHGKLVWFSSNFDPQTHQWLGWKQLFEDPFNIWMGVIGGTIMVMSSHGAEQLIVQRVLACKSVKDGRKALALSAVVVFPLFFVFLLTGAMLWTYYQTHPMPIPLPEVEKGKGITQNDFVYPIFMLSGVPHILKGFLIVAILSAAMSSVSSALTSLSSVSTMDFFKKLLPDKSDEFFLRLSKGSTAFWAVLLIVVAYLSREVASVLDIAFKLRGLTSGALLGGLLLAVFWRKGTSTPIVIGMVTSLLVMAYLSPLVQGLPNLPVALRSPVKLAFAWYTTFGTAIMFFTAFIARAVLTLKAAVAPRPALD
jgi:SSS family solute:Na+ symporter